MLLFHALWVSPSPSSFFPVAATTAASTDFGLHVSLRDSVSNDDNRRKNSEGGGGGAPPERHPVRLRPLVAVAKRTSHNYNSTSLSLLRIRISMALSLHSPLFSSSIGSHSVPEQA